MKHSLSILTLSLYLLVGCLNSSNHKNNSNETPEGDWSSGGGYALTDSTNPWFLQNTLKVFYCIKIDEKNFGQTKTLSQEFIKDSIQFWKNEFSNTLPVYYEGQEIRLATQEFIYQDSCGEKTDLVFQLGVLEDSQYKYLNNNPKDYVAAAIRTDYDKVNLRGKGFIYVSPSQVAQSHPLALERTDLLPNRWRALKGFYLSAILKHEIGHIFGLTFSEFPIMNPSVGYLLSNDILDNMKIDNNTKDVEDFEYKISNDLNPLNAVYITCDHSHVSHYYITTNSDKNLLNNYNCLEIRLRTRIESHDIDFDGNLLYEDAIFENINKAKAISIAPKIEFANQFNYINLFGSFELMISAFNKNDPDQRIELSSFIGIDNTLEARSNGYLVLPKEQKIYNNRLNRFYVSTYFNVGFNAYRLQSDREITGFWKNFKQENESVGEEKIKNVKIKKGTITIENSSSQQFDFDFDLNHYSVFRVE